MTKTPRRKDYVDPEVQGELARRLVIHWLLFTVVASLIAVCLEWLHDPFRSTSVLLSETWQNYGAFLLVLVCLVPVFVFDAIKLSNRFAGPVYRLRQTARALADGRLPPHIELRGNDFWRDLADDLNRVIDRVSQAESQVGATDPNSDTWPVADDQLPEVEPVAVAGRIEN